MAHYQRQGSVPPKRHTQHRRPAGRGRLGALYHEELMGEEGFSSDSSLLYHREIPSALVDVREWSLPDQATTPNHPLQPRHLRLHDLFDAAAVRRTDPVTGRRLVLGNGDVRISYAVSARPSPWYRNGLGDEVVYVERGRARLETVFGAFDVGEGDLVVVPRATTHRWLPRRSPKDPLRTYSIEATSHVAPPHRYLSRYGQLLEHAPYCERDLRLPQGPLLAEDVGASPGRRPRCWSSTAEPAGRSSGRCTSCRTTRSTSWGGTAASTPTSSTSPTSSRSPGGCTSRRRCTRSSRWPAP